MSERSSTARRLTIFGLSLLPLVVAIALLFNTVALPQEAAAEAEAEPLEQEGDRINTDLQVVRVTVEDDAQLEAIAEWADPRRAGPNSNDYFLEANASDLAWLDLNGYRYEVDEARTAVLQAPREPNEGGGIPGYACYRTVEETFDTATNIVATYPNLAEWIDVGDSWEKTQDPNAGYDMNVLKLTNKSTGGNKPSFFATSAIHAREYTTAELMTRFAEQLVQGYGSNADATWLLDHHEIHLMLQANPDGRKQAEAGLSWRKNTNNNFCSNLPNRGVDLNRNFEFQWGCCGGSSPSPCNLTYRGPSPASEPETQAVQNYGLQIFPDQRADPITEPAPADAMGVYLDIHSYSQLVLWPWGFTTTPTGNASAFQTFGRRLAYFNDYYPEQAVGLYPTDGTTDDFFYGELGVAGFTFELGTAFFQSCDYFEQTILPGNMPALFYAAKAARTPYLTPAGPDVLNLALDNSSVAVGESVTLTATVDDTRFNNSNGTEPTQPIIAAEYYVDVPPWAGGTPVPLSPADGNFNSPVEGVTGTINTTGWSGGQHLIYVRGQDAAGNWGVISSVFLYVEGPLSQSIYLPAVFR